MLSTLIFNLFASLIALSVSGSVILHDTRLDKAFATTVAPASDTTVRDFSHTVMSDQHVHQSHVSMNGAGASDPGLTNRSHKKHIYQPHARVRLASLVG